MSLIRLRTRSQLRATSAPRAVSFSWTKMVVDPGLETLLV